MHCPVVSRWRNRSLHSKTGVRVLRPVFPCVYLLLRVRTVGLIMKAAEADRCVTMGRTVHEYIVNLNRMARCISSEFCDKFIFSIKAALRYSVSVCVKHASFW